MYFLNIYQNSVFFYHFSIHTIFLSLTKMVTSKYDFNIEKKEGKIM